MPNKMRVKKMFKDDELHEICYYKSNKILQIINEVKNDG